MQFLRLVNCYLHLKLEMRITASKYVGKSLLPPCGQQSVLH
jgi:hypothetical protein